MRRVFSNAMIAIAIAIAAGWTIPSADSKPTDESWVVHARRLTGESDAIRQDAIRKLKKYPRLNEALARAVSMENGSPYYLALDVVTTLRLQALLPELVRSSERDATGTVYHAINSVLTEKSLPEIRRVYYERALSDATPLPARVVLLDSLGRMRVLLKQEALNSMLRNEVPEIRQAALYYLRQMILRADQKEYLNALRIALKDPVLQVRVQALHFASELSVGQRSAFLPAILDGCSIPEGADAQTERLCSRLKGDSP